MDLMLQVIALLAGMVGLFTGVIRYRQEKMNRLIVEAELQTARSSFDFAEILEDWTDIQAELTELFKTTCIDRFIIFRAWNGYLSPKWTTSLYQQRNLDQKLQSYIHFEIDADYVERLRQVHSTKIETWTVSEMPDSLLKEVYSAEHIKSTVWAHVHTRQPTSRLKGMTYCSFSTSKEGKISKETINKCRIIANMLSGMVMKSEEE